MNDFSELESELKQLRPRAVSSDLTSRVALELDGPSERNEAERNGVEESRGNRLTVLQRDPSTSLGMTEETPRRTFLGSNWMPLGLGLAAAAAFLFLARINVEQKPDKAQSFAALTPAPSFATTNTPDNFVPAGVTQVVYNTRDEGLHFTAGGSEPVRRLRSRTRETMQWENPRTGASLRVSYPSEEVTLIPVPGQ